jgi:hypothetical protein
MRNRLLDTKLFGMTSSYNPDVGTVSNKKREYLLRSFPYPAEIMDIYGLVSGTVPDNGIENGR